MWRPRSARWFEVLCPRSESVHLCAVLARTGAVQIEAREIHRSDSGLHELHQGLLQYQEIKSIYGRYWQGAGLAHSSRDVLPLEVLERALGRIERWRGQADPLISRLQVLEDEQHRIGLCARVMQALQGQALDFTRVGECGPKLALVTAILPIDTRLPGTDAFVLQLRVPLDTDSYLMALGTASGMERMTSRIKSAGGRLLVHPPWLRGSPDQALVQILDHLAGLKARIQDLGQQLDELFYRHRLGLALGDLSNLQWFAERIGALQQAGEHFTLVTGWCDDPDGAILTRALAQQPTHALIHFPPPPAGIDPPQLLDNPPWARPFEILVKALGMPGPGEADPSPLLALVAPLLFGYMFGDLGQGLVLLLLGWLLRRSFPLARLLMAAGASAALFGLVFGSLFGVEHIIPALWLHPLEQPLLLLAAPLAFAVLLLSLGQLLNAAQAWWQGRLRQWLWTDAGFLLLYLGLTSCVLSPRYLWIAALGAAWLLLGSARIGGPRQILSAIGEILERGLQLLVNTLSFARVGAFALAHAGLSSAMLSMADASGSAWGWVLVMTLGNLLIIALEGLVVSIQTTRLLLFEFFNRFLQGNGRIFSPLPTPPTLLQGDTP